MANNASMPSSCSILAPPLPQQCNIGSNEKPTSRPEAGASLLGRLSHRIRVKSTFAYTAMIALPRLRT